MRLSCLIGIAEATFNLVREGLGVLAAKFELFGRIIRKIFGVCISWTKSKEVHQGIDGRVRIDSFEWRAMKIFALKNRCV